jgi:hypothetical protein
MVGLEEKGKEERKGKYDKNRFDCDIFLNRPWPFIFIGWGGLVPQGNPFTSIIFKNSSIWLGIRGHRSDLCTQRVDLGEFISPSLGLQFGRSTYES